MGYEVVAMLEDGDDALEFLEEHRVDVILADICMYQVSGLDLAKIVKEKYPWMKVVLLSGYREFEYAKEAISCGVYEYLLKPLDYSKLRSVFMKIKEELDHTQQEEMLLYNLGEKEYQQILSLLQIAAGSVLGEEEDTWLTYARLKPVVENAPAEIRQVITKKLLEILHTRLLMMDAELAEIFSEKLKALRSQEMEKTEQIYDLSGIIRQLNDQLVSKNLIPNVRGRDDGISKACSYMNNHLGDNLTYKDVAEFVHLSPRHFIRRFRNEMGEAFSEYLFRIRMEAAKRLLDERLVLPEDVGEAVGYRDEKYFRQLFKKYTGYTLREYQTRRGNGL